MNSEIERVARAIATALYSPTYYDNLPAYRESLHKVAEAAIAAMPLQSLLAQAQEALELERAAHTETVATCVTEIKRANAAERKLAALLPNAGEGR